MIAFLLMSIIIVDGDGLKINGQAYRLEGIDAVELHQTCQDASNKPYNCGQSAKDHLTTLIHNKVTCTDSGQRSYNRIVATCYSNGQDLGEEQVRAGWAISYKYFSHKYDAQELDAKINKRGIWAGKFEEPYKWRKENE